MKSNLLFSWVLLMILYVDITPQSWWNVGTPIAKVNMQDMALDNNNTPFVVIRDESHANKATVLKFDGVGWVTLGSAGFSDGVVDRMSISINVQNTIYVAVADSSNSDKATVWKFNGSKWITVGSSGFSDGAAGYICLSFDGNGSPYVVYSDGAQSAFQGNKATVMKYNGTSWGYLGSPGFTSHAAASTNLVIDRNNVPYITYRDLSTQDVAVMKFDGSSWVQVPRIATVGLTGGSASYPWLAIDPSNTLYVSFNDNSNSRAAVMKYDGSNWIDVGAISSGYIYETCLAFYGSTPYLVFAKYGSISPTIMKFDGSNWGVVGSITSFAAYTPKIKITNTGIPLITYLDRDSLISKKFTSGPDVMLSVEKNSRTLPTKFYVSQNYPNPFNPTTTINYSIPNTSVVMLRIYDLLGKEISELVNEQKQPGNYEIQFNGSHLSSGVYFYQLQAGSFVQTKKFVLMK